MLFVGLLSAFIVFLMFFNLIKTAYLFVICIFILVLLLFLKDNHSESLFSIDLISRENKMTSLKIEIKMVISMIFISMCIFSSKAVVGLFILILSSIILIFFAKIKIKTYIKFLCIPMVFIFMGGLAIIVNYSKYPLDLINLKLGNAFLGISKSSQIEARLVVFKSFGAVSALYLVSLTSPISDIIHFFKKMHFPSIFVDLMYLIYRCIFIMYEMYIVMKNAAKGRMGFSSYRRGIKTTAKIYSNLLVRSYLSSSKMFDAMVSRAYDGEINFLREKE